MDPSHQGRSSLSELCLVLVGSISCGKTLTADTLLGQSSSVRPSASTRECHVRRGRSAGRMLSVVETPRWYWRGRQLEADVQVETQRALSLTMPGPPVFLILIPVGEFTEMEQRIPDELERMFGPSVLDRTLVLLTCGDYLMDRTLQEYLRKEAGLREVVHRCRGHCHVINNRRPDDRQQVNTLLEKVEQMMHGGEETSEVPERSQMKLETAGKMMWNGEKQTHSTNTSDRHKEETGSDVMIDKRLINGLHSQQYECVETYSANTHTLLERSPSFKLNKEGAILSQLLEGSEVQSTQSFINTIHHSIKKDLDASETAVCSSSDVQNDCHLPELRIVLLGRRGSGKSSAGNVILGNKLFGLHSDVTAISQRCVKGRAVVHDRQVSLIDTPDWFESERSPEEVKGQISSCVALSAPGPHAFLLCVPVNRPAHSELEALRALEAVFGFNAVRRHTIILFTHCDLLPEGGTDMERVEEYITTQRPEMLQLVERCGDRYHVLQHDEQKSGVKELLEKVEQTVKESGGTFYNSESRDHTRPDQISSTVWRERQRDKPNTSHSLHALRETEEDEVVMDGVVSMASGQNVCLESPTPPSLLHSVWDSVGSGARRVPKLIAVGALVGAALGVFLAGAVGGAVGAVVGSVVSEVGRRRYTKHKIQ
ncbi:uncharacterized protein LOC127446183 [Myxocyprinus asiaticus]|uniref:uncharacterized protein LOC127446183 n=1 Tax=Myxocyprinus asiaticus TaxID=70543 RepID=UPI002222061A|nr:uncharacterized protein LOC127446183 [Myxocyprinus asiaticus]XP_051562854.1 uncharacterized protein LOC127446183 [Myxocyprinus asiaticus]XP_051562855.1 uncharacterized protein LOC127446183 [Myxocyprinus asiaticus]XP_051562856.1 uncharacterized protein LOC127446183 [Myxocyprinus asiaticus]XP_051562857.1 uncharacterized protein LOC127446183 [Myxocyprinus asiaticus]XP_051562858.1 uncharacterized protein LOC127446183 [Myxocyprinus asiaticus]XP_051562860.1 uncharacterized protein LOC127446183 [